MIGRITRKCYENFLNYHAGQIIISSSFLSSYGFILVHLGKYYFVVLRLCYYFTDPPGAPTIEGYSDSDHVVEDRAARMTCKSVGGNPTATLRWFKGKGAQMVSDQQLYTVH